MKKEQKINITEKLINADGDSRQVDCFVIPPTNTFENIDCMEMLKKCPDKYFDLAIVDPPYGLGNKVVSGGSSSPFIKAQAKKFNNWDASPPASYFEELFRTSKNQIVWGGNHFGLPSNRCFLIWDKTIYGNSYSDCEYAWTSFDKPARLYRENIAVITSEGRIHPTQKSIGLYRWILNYFGRAGDLILDTHVGSGSSIIACIEGGFNYYGCEIDKDYYDAARKRIARAFRKYELFENEAV